MQKEKETYILVPVQRTPPPTEKKKGKKKRKKKEVPSTSIELANFDWIVFTPYATPA